MPSKRDAIQHNKEAGKPRILKYGVTNARNASDVRGKITCIQLDKFAELLHCESQFEKEQNRPNYRAALVNYHRALWGWVWQLTSQKALKVVDTALLKAGGSLKIQAENSFTLQGYLLWRAIFLVGMKTGESFNPIHWKYFADKAKFAKEIGDNEVFEEIARYRRYQKPKSDPRQRGDLKYYLILSWLVAGMWRLSRDKQLAALKKLWPNSPKYVVDAIYQAEKTLGLERPVNPI